MINTPFCDGLVETEGASARRSRLNELLSLGDLPMSPSPLEQHILHGLACTVGSALGSTPPSVEQCLLAFTASNSAGLSVGARAWSKHGHRSGEHPATAKMTKDSLSSGWWGRPKGPVETINANALELFWRVINNVTWKNLHWLPHQVLVYEVRVQEGYGMRWSRSKEGPWLFRGFVEPMMVDGHERGWLH